MKKVRLQVVVHCPKLLHSQTNWHPDEQFPVKDSINEQEDEKLTNGDNFVNGYTNEDNEEDIVIDNATQDFQGYYEDHKGRNLRFSNGKK